MKQLAIAIAAALVLSACGKDDSVNSSGKPATSPAGIVGTYKSTGGKITFTFNGGKVRIADKVGNDFEYSYSIDGNQVKWVYEATGVAESCEIKSGTAIYCAMSRDTFTKID